MVNHSRSVSVLYGDGLRLEAKLLCAGAGSTAGGHLASLNWNIQSFESTHALGRKITLTIATLSTAILFFFFFFQFCLAFFVVLVLKRRLFINYLCHYLSLPQHILCFLFLNFLHYPRRFQFSFVQCLASARQFVQRAVFLQNRARTPMWSSLSSIISKMSN